MRLNEIFPRLNQGQTVQCCHCREMVREAIADLDGEPGTFYCKDCADMLDLPDWDNGPSYAERRGSGEL